MERRGFTCEGIWGFGLGMKDLVDCRVIFELDVC